MYTHFGGGWHLPRTVRKNEMQIPNATASRRHLTLNDVGLDKFICFRGHHSSENVVEKKVMTFHFWAKINFIWDEKWSEIFFSLITTLSYEKAAETFQRLGCSCIKPQPFFSRWLNIILAGWLAQRWFKMSVKIRRSDTQNIHFAYHKACLISFLITKWFGTDFSQPRDVQQPSQFSVGTFLGWWTIIKHSQCFTVVKSFSCRTSWSKIMRFILKYMRSPQKYRTNPYLYCILDASCLLEVVN